VIGDRFDGRDAIDPVLEVRGLGLRAPDAEHDVGGGEWRAVLEAHAVPQPELPVRRINDLP
jgi:hypothetical protein